MRICSNWLPGLFALTLLFYAGSSAGAQQAADQFAPESGDTRSQNKALIASEFIVVSAHPLASQAGYNVLNKGGNAIDAMVAVQLVLGLVEPQSSGLGGGAFMLYYDQKTKHLRSFDGRETAPLQAPTDLFMAADSTPMDFFEAVVGGLSVGTPGTVKLLWQTHQKLGKQSWPELLEPLIAIAREGFEVSPRLANAIEKDQDKLSTDPDSAAYFFPNGHALRAGQLLRNPQYADTLSLLAKHGGDYFYQPAFYNNLVNKVQRAKKPGYLSGKDFDTYQIIERQPVCSSYHAYKICGMGPPSSGALSVNATLGMLQSFDLKSLSPDDPKAWHLIAEASRLAFADRGLYIADPDFFDVPDTLLAEAYLRERSRLIDPRRSTGKVSPGVPPKINNSKLESAQSPEQESTTHFVIVDRDRNIVSMTSTIENGFGSRLMVNGFLLNNELTDFSFAPQKNGALVANRVQPGKRPRSSMAPTIVFKENKPYLALGSTGGSRIINYVTNSLIAILDWQMSLPDAFNMPHIINRFGTMDIEENTEAIRFKDRFVEMAYPVSVRNLNSGLHGVLFSGDKMTGAADPRREGLALGR